METLHGIRFLPVARIQGTLLGLDARWMGTRGLVLMLALALATPAGPLANALFGTAFVALALVLTPDSFASGWLTQVGALQLITALANLLPFGPMDGTNIVAAWRG